MENNSYFREKPISNGRVNIMNPLPPTSNLFKLYDKNPVKQCSNYRNATEGLWDETLLSKAFFSDNNI